MMFLHKFLPFLFQPLTISLILVLFRRRAFVWAAVLLLWISSTPVVGGLLARVAEGPAERARATEAPTADAIVVLSAGRIIAPGHAAISEWEDADRFFGGVELFLAGKAPLLVFTGAQPNGPRGVPLEGETLSTYARGLGVPQDRIATTGAVANTQEEANGVAVLLRVQRAGPTRVLLVTSAFHMPRARLLFERAGFAIVPFPVDFQYAAGSRLNVMDFLPSAVGLQKTHAMLHELYGRLFYRVTGLFAAG
ncbi:MAG: YdcF family protein [Verrucomicrobia bacterium]|nr:YdcF family protein [Verrucomicrobiota bacterium]